MERNAFNGTGTSDLLKTKKAKALRQQAQDLFLQAYYGEHLIAVRFIAKVRTEEYSVVKLNTDYLAQIKAGKLNRRSAISNY